MSLWYILSYKYHAEEANIIEAKYENVSKSMSSLLISGMKCTIWESDFN